MTEITTCITKITTCIKIRCGLPELSSTYSDNKTALDKVPWIIPGNVQQGCVSYFMYCGQERPLRSQGSSS